MKFYLALTIRLFLAIPAWATTFENVAWLGCYDGDTCSFTLPGVHPFFGEKISVRMRRIDTPEMRGKCPAEERLARPPPRRRAGRPEGARGLPAMASTGPCPGKPTSALAPSSASP